MTNFPETTIWVIALSLVIIVLVIYFLKHMKDVVEATFEFMTKQAEINRVFMGSLQDAHSHSISRLAEEIKSQRTETVKELANLTQRVDGVIDKAIMLERLLPGPPANVPERRIK